MAHKHNRRRIRPRNRQHSPEDQPQYPLVDQVSSPRPFPVVDASSTFPAFLSSPHLKPRATYRSNNLTAQHWQNRYVAWQRRDKAQKDEAAKLEADRVRLFGGEPGDDPTLCYRMLEFFGGLDFIDT